MGRILNKKKIIKWLFLECHCAPNNIGKHLKQKYSSGTYFILERDRELPIRNIFTTKIKGNHLLLLKHTHEYKRKSVYEVIIKIPINEYFKFPKLYKIAAPSMFYTPSEFKELRNE